MGAGYCCCTELQCQFLIFLVVLSHDKRMHVIPHRISSRFSFVFAAFLFIFPGMLSLCSAADETPGKRIVLYTALTATTPQIPLWAAIREGWPAGHDLDIRYWKNLDDLRGVMLAGKGDIWVGNLEGFAQAARRGAPVTLIAVTAWKKFYFVTTGEKTITSFEAMKDALEKSGEPLAVTPQDGPALGVLDVIGKKSGQPFTVAPLPPQQLMLEMVRGNRPHALVPEPLLSLLLAKRRDIRIVGSLEAEYAKQFGGEARLPLAGIAVNTAFAKAHPELLKKLVQAMQDKAPLLNTRPEKAIAVLPKEVRDTLGVEILKASLSRDLIHVESADKVRAQVAAFLNMTVPQRQENSLKGDTLPSSSFILPGL